MFGPQLQHSAHRSVIALWGLNQNKPPEKSNNNLQALFRSWLRASLNCLVNEGDGVLGIGRSHRGFRVPVLVMITDGAKCTVEECNGCVSESSDCETKKVQPFGAFDSRHSFARLANKYCRSPKHHSNSSSNKGGFRTAGQPRLLAINRRMKGHPLPQSFL